MHRFQPWPMFSPNLDPPVVRSLSIQFVLQEYLSAIEGADQLGLVTKENLESGKLGQELDRLLRCSLDKLCFYCQILLQASHVNNDEIPLVLEEMKNAINQIKTKMIRWKNRPEDTILAMLAKLHSDLLSQLRRFFPILSLYLREARTDENVLAYLIEHKEPFNTFLGPRTIESLLQQFFPEGYEQLRAVMCEGYTRRGFGSFFTKLEPQIDAIERENSCMQEAP